MTVAFAVLEEPTDMSKAFAIPAVLVLSATLSFAQSAAPDAQWQKLRDLQPASLHLKMTLAKDHYFQGEKIDARLDYSNDDPKTIYLLRFLSYLPGATFHAVDDKGHAVVDPVKWQNDWWHDPNGGVMGEYKLGQYNATWPVNANVRFDQPGLYRIYAQTQVDEDSNQTGLQSTFIVSDPVTVTITAITPEQEKQTITEALSLIKTDFSPSEGMPPSTWKGLDDLVYLQTPAARAELIKLLA